jgi:hypothetical protein
VDYRLPSSAEQSAVNRHKICFGHATERAVAAGAGGLFSTFASFEKAIAGGQHLLFEKIA